MVRSFARPALTLTALATVVVSMGACHSAPPPVTPAPARVATNSDSLARAQAAARDAARRDSIARAEAAQRDAAARAAADQRARDAAAAAKAALDSKIFFDYQLDELRPDARAALDAKVPVLRQFPNLRIRIEGNADERGSGEYNVALGQRRSAAAKRYLVSRGIDDARIDIVSFGEERPVCHDESEACWHQNRRDEFLVVAGDDALRGRK